MSNKPLTPEQKLVAHHYLADPERDRRAAWLCVYASEGNVVADDVAMSASWRLFRKPAFAAYLAAEIERINRNVHLEEEMVLQEWAKIGFLDPAEAFGIDGKLLAIHEMPVHVRKALSSFELDEDGRTAKVKFCSKTAALDSMGKHFGLFKKVRELRLTWMEGASVGERMKRRDYIRAELERRGVLKEEKEVEGEVMRLGPLDSEPPERLQ